MTAQTTVTGTIIEMPVSSRFREERPNTWFGRCVTEGCQISLSIAKVIHIGVTILILLFGLGAIAYLDRETKPVAKAWTIGLGLFAGISIGAAECLYREPAEERLSLN